MRDKPILISNHARMQLSYRGTSEAEIVRAVRQSPWESAELGRHQCRKDFHYNQIWNGKHYKKKRVCPVFAEEKNAIVIITVYVYYF